MTKLTVVLFVTASLGLSGADMTRVSASASIFSAPGGWEEKDCSHAGLRGSVGCNVELQVYGDDGFWAGSGGAASDASAEVGYVYAGAGAGGWGVGSGGGMAKASAFDDNYFVIPGSGTVTVTAHYDVDRYCPWPCPLLEVTQAGVSARLDEGGLPWVTSKVSLGVPFEVDLQASAFALECCAAEEIDSGSIRLLGFFDRDGQPHPYSLVPEPSFLWPFSASAGAILLIAKRNRGRKRPARL